MSVRLSNFTEYTNHLKKFIIKVSLVNIGLRNKIRNGLGTFSSVLIAVAANLSIVKQAKIAPAKELVFTPKTSFEVCEVTDQTKKVKESSYSRNLLDVPHSKINLKSTSTISKVNSFQEISPGNYSGRRPNSNSLPTNSNNPLSRAENKWEKILQEIIDFKNGECFSFIKQAEEIESNYVGNLIFKKGISLPLKNLNIGKGEPFPLKYYDLLDCLSASSDKKRYEDLNKQFLQKMNHLRGKIMKNSDPLHGIDLAGIGEEKLKKLPDCGKTGIDNFPKIISMPPDIVAKYKDWVLLPATGDGNCFLHSYSIFLTGRNDLDLTLRLRVAMCCELMAKLENWLYTEKNCFARAFNRVLDLTKIAQNRSWLSNLEIDVLGYILKRNLIVISNFNNSYLESYSFDPIAHNITDAYPETWVIYNGGNHFQPLIKK